MMTKILKTLTKKARQLMKIEVDESIIDKLFYLITELLIACDNHTNICMKMAEDLNTLDRAMNFQKELAKVLKGGNDATN
mgnify:CR=1 FL=1